MNLREYVNGRDDVVIFFVSVGQPQGDYTVAGYPDLDFADRRRLYDLEGRLGGNDEWYWDGDGDPTDDRGNSVLKVHAYVSPEMWAKVVGEYENAG